MCYDKNIVPNLKSLSNLITLILLSNVSSFQRDSLVSQQSYI